MCPQRGAHDVERVAVATILGVEPRQELQRLDLGLVAAPDRGQRLEIGDGVGALEVAAPVLQTDLAQPPLRGRGPVP